MIHTTQWILIFALTIASTVHAVRAREGAWIAVYLWALILCEGVRWWAPEGAQWLIHADQALYLVVPMVLLPWLAVAVFERGRV